MRTIIGNIFNRQTAVLLALNIGVALLLLGFMTAFHGLLNRYTAYIFVAPFMLILLFQWKQPVLKIAAPVFTLIFLENTIISRIPVVTVPYMSEGAVFFKMGVTFVFAITILSSLLYYNQKLKLPKGFAVLWMLFLALAFASMIIGGSIDLGFMAGNVNDFITYYLISFVFFYIGYRGFQRPEEINRFLFILLIFGIITAVAHIFAITTGTNIEGVRGQEAVAEGRDLSQDNWRYGGFFGNVNTMSAFYVMLIPAALYTVFSGTSAIKKIIAALAILSMVVSMLMGASRGGILWSVLGILVCLFYLKISWQKILTGVVLTAVVVVVADQLLGQLFQEYFQRSIDEITRKGTDSPREIIWYYTMFIIRDNPLGIGLSTYNFSRELMFYGNMDWSNPHNMYLEMITQTGFAGLFVFLIMLFRTIYSNIRAYFRTKEQAVRDALVFLLLFLVGFFLMGFTEPIFRNQYKINYIFSLMLGISLSLSTRICSSEGKNKDIGNLKVSMGLKDGRKQ